VLLTLLALPLSFRTAEISDQGAPGVLNATGTLTAAMILSGIVTSTTGCCCCSNLDTGAIWTQPASLPLVIRFDWSVIATGANAFTVTAAATGHTVVGTAAVATVTSGAWRTRKTAAETFVSYRIG
jgi:hypothetical protein